MRIVVVEDNRLVAKGLELTLRDMGHQVCGTPRTAEEALASIERHRPDLITCDVDLGGGGSGVDVARAARERWGVRTLFIAAEVDGDLLARTRDLDPLGHIAKGRVGGGLQAEPFCDALSRALSLAP